MPSTAPTFDIDALAALARIDLTRDERERFRAQLGDVLAYVAQLAEAPVGDGSSLGLGAGVRLRDDVAGPSLPREAALANAADTLAGFFRVPPMRE